MDLQSRWARFWTPVLPNNVSKPSLAKILVLTIISKHHRTPRSSKKATKSSYQVGGFCQLSDIFGLTSIYCSLISESAAFHDSLIFDCVISWATLHDFALHSSLISWSSEYSLAWQNFQPQELLWMRLRSNGASCCSFLRGRIKKACADIWKNIIGNSDATLFFVCALHTSKLVKYPRRLNMFVTNESYPLFYWLFILTKKFWPYT